LRAEDRATLYTFHLTGPDDPATVVAVEAGEIRGFATTGPARATAGTVAGKVYALYVDPRAWWRGIGRVLMTNARSRLVRRGFTEAVLWVRARNVRAERFYRADARLPDGRRREEDLLRVRVHEIGYRRPLP
jgi:ribosomal protein S18 acetylase RimI-like enzyme